MPKFCKYKYLHVKIASLAIAKPCVTVGRKYFHLVHLSWVSIQPCACTVDASMTTTSDCMVKLA